MWHQWKGDQFQAVYKAHVKLGPVVRIGPNHLSFAELDAFKKIYGHSVPTVKDEFYANFAAGNPSMFLSTDKSIHSAKRRNLAHVFSAKEITNMEPRVMKVAENLCSALKVKATSGVLGDGDEYKVVNGAINIVPWLNMFTWDAIASMMFSYDYGFLVKGNDICPALDADGATEYVHAMESFHSGSRFSTTLAHLPMDLYKLSRKALFFTHGFKSGLKFFGMAKALIKYRMENEPAVPDLFSRLPVAPTEKRPNPISMQEIVAECAGILDAGSDTTQTTLGNCIYHLATNPDKQQKLYDALVAGVPQEYRGSNVVPSEILKTIPYLRAVLEENWRRRPPITRGLPRVTKRDGMIIAGHAVAEGVTVSGATYALHQDETLFPEAEKFIPERWIPEDEFVQSAPDMKDPRDCSLPFSVGPRACIGRNLAYMEVSITVAALALNFEWTLAKEYEDMPAMERFNCNPKELFVYARVR